MECRWRAGPGAVPGGPCRCSWGAARPSAASHTLPPQAAAAAAAAGRRAPEPSHLHMRAGVRTPAEEGRREAALKHDRLASEDCTPRLAVTRTTPIAQRDRHPPDTRSAVRQNRRRLWSWARRLRRLAMTAAPACMHSCLARLAQQQRCRTHCRWSRSLQQAWQPSVECGLPSSTSRPRLHGRCDREAQCSQCSADADAAARPSTADRMDSQAT